MLIQILSILCVLLFSQGSCQVRPCDKPGRFKCGGGICISKARVCDDVEDCPGGKDELDCHGTRTCRKNEAWVKDHGYVCRKRPCQTKADCRGRLKQCVCDDECGYSCLNPYSQCDRDPPKILNGEYRHIRRKRPIDGRLIDELVEHPYYYGDMIMYRCNTGYRLDGPLPRCSGHRNWTAELPQCVDTACREGVPAVDHSTYRFRRPSPRRNTILIVANTSIPVFNDFVEYICEPGLMLTGEPPKCVSYGRWSPHTSKCVVPCFDKFNEDEVVRYGLTCGTSCFTDDQCDSSEECYCDGPCSRVCVDRNVDCEEAPDIEHATLNYTGSGIRRVARYSCEYGYYLARGSLSLRCSGSGRWIGEEPICSPVYCGDPTESIRATRGSISQYGGISVGDVMEFGCPGNTQMLGARTRTCLGNGKWSGQLTICDSRDGEDRCPHPGVPTNGKLIAISDNFRIGSTVRYECEDNYVLYGDKEQTCLWMKEWSGTGVAPTCADPRYPHTSEDVIGALTRSLATLPDQKTSLGRFISADATERQEIYFLFDVSESVLKKIPDLKAEIEFAKRLVQRMEGFKGEIDFGIMVFASENVTALDISESADKPKSIKQILKILDDVYVNAAQEKYKQRTRSGTATAFALRKLRGMIAWMNTQPGRKNAKRHCFIFTDGKHTEDVNPVKIRENIEAQFRPNIEFYSITACKQCNTGDSQNELVGLSSKGGENYIFIEDFYLLSSYLDRVTDVKLDFKKCGQAGDVGSIKQQASLGRSTGGEDAAENAWPWQALISRRSSTPKKSLERTKLLGGASILNNKWILTAAHVLDKEDKSMEDWKTKFVISVGVISRNPVRSSTKMYSIDEYIPHENYENEASNNFEHDIALIKLGPSYTAEMLKNESDNNGLTFGFYIRPVCLPCTGACLTEEQLVDDKGISLITPQMNDEQKCREEEILLLDNHAKVVVTGFGHLNKSKWRINLRNFNPPNVLRQALLQIESKVRCRDQAEEIRELEDMATLKYSDNMICCKSGDPNKVIDSCKGDSGGPVVREVRNKETGKSCWIQIGIVSFGYRCGSDFPGYYTNVARYVPWIQEKINEPEPVVILPEP